MSEANRADFRVTRAAVAALATALLLAASGMPSHANRLAEKAPEKSAPDKGTDRGTADKAPGDKAGKAATAKTLKERMKLLGELYDRLSKAEDSTSAEVIAQAIEQMWLHSGSDTINLLMERSLEAINKKDHVLATRLLDSVVQLAPRYVEGWNRRAYVHFVQNDYQAAIEDLKRVLVLDPNHFKAIDGLGHILREVGEKGGALKAYRHLLKIHPHWSGAKEAVQELEREVEGQAL